MAEEKGEGEKKGSYVSGKIDVALRRQTDDKRVCLQCRL